MGATVWSGSDSTGCSSSALQLWIMPFLLRPLTSAISPSCNAQEWVAVTRRQQRRRKPSTMVRAEKRPVRTVAREARQGPCVCVCVLVRVIV